MEDAGAGDGVRGGRQGRVARRNLGGAHEAGEGLDVGAEGDACGVADPRDGGDTVAVSNAATLTPFEVFSVGWSGLVMPISFK